jgi:hypothetical protein
MKLTQKGTTKTKLRLIIIFKVSCFSNIGVDVGISRASDLDLLVATLRLQICGATRRLMARLRCDDVVDDMARRYWMWSNFK